MTGASARISLIGAITCSSHCSCQSASARSSSPRAWLVPALFTSAHGGSGQALEEPLAGVGSGHVELHVRAVARHGEHARALLREHAGGGGADPPRAAGDDTDPAFETEVHER